MTFRRVPITAYKHGVHVGIACKHCTNHAQVVATWGAESMALYAECSPEWGTP